MIQHGNKVCVICMILVLKADCLILLTFFYQIFYQVRVGTTLSDLQGQEEGVPQGSILSVTNFSIKINNIVKALNPGVDCSLWGLPIGPTAHWSYDPLVLRPIGPTTHWSYGP